MSGLIPLTTRFPGQSVTRTITFETQNNDLTTRCVTGIAKTIRWFITISMLFGCRMHASFLVRKWSRLPAITHCIALSGSRAVKWAPGFPQVITLPKVVMKNARGSYLTQHSYLTRHLPQNLPCRATFRFLLYVESSAKFRQSFKKPSHKFFRLNVGI